MSSNLPPWADTLRDRYLAGEASMFLVHGNIRDLQPWVADDGTLEWLDIRRFLERFLGRTRDIVAYYNVSQGMCFSDRAHEKRLRRVVNARRTLDGKPELGALPRAPSEAIEVIEELVTEPLQAAAVVVDFFEMIAPNADVSFMANEDRANLVATQRWASDPAFLSTDNLVILLTEHLSDVSRRVVASPQLVTIQVPFPDLDLRTRFLADATREAVPLDVGLEMLGRISAGLTLLQIRALIRGAVQTGRPITFDEVSVRKKTIIEQECHGLVELVQPRHDFSHVGGMDRIKQDLMRVAGAVRDGRRNRVPMGMIFVGPMGTGKTYLAEAFAAESGLTCLKFKNFREKWVGSTESNLEKILELVEALGFVLLIIDEADRSLSSGESDGGTASRVIARLKEFMSDTSHRGRVVILMMTNRPDKLDTDLKRPGRFDLKIPFFFAETAEERKLILAAQVRKNKVDLAEGVDLAPIAATTAGFSSAEIESVVISAVNRAAEAGSDVVDQVAFQAAAADVVPSRDTRMLEYMEMLAVFEASARRMLPERFQHLDTESVQARLDELRMMLGRRVL